MLYKVSMYINIAASLLWPIAFVTKDGPSHGLNHQEVLERKNTVREKIQSKRGPFSSRKGICKFIWGMVPLMSLVIYISVLQK